MFAVSSGAPVSAAVAAIIDESTTRCVRAERAFLRTLGGGCDLPTGAHATLDTDGCLQMTAVLATPDRERIERASGIDHDGEKLGIELATELLVRVGSAEPQA